MDSETLATQLLEKHYMAGVAIYQKTTVEITPGNLNEAGKITNRLTEDGIPYAFNGVRIWLTKRYYTMFGEQLMTEYGCDNK